MSDGTEGASPRYATIETWPAATILAALHDNQLSAVAAVRATLPSIEGAAEAAAARLQEVGVLAYAGAGTSGRIAVQDGAELPPTFGWPRARLLLCIAGGAGALLQAVEGAEDDEAAARADIATLGPGDVLVAVAASGRTPYTAAAMATARNHGALTIGIANNPDSRLLQAAEHPILLATGAEPVAGSTRMGAGTAQKAALNLFSTLLMMRLGRVHRGRMLDMQASNDKLRTRAVQMLCELEGVSSEMAQAALEASGGAVRAALERLRR